MQLIFHLSILLLNHFLQHSLMLLSISFCLCTVILLPFCLLSFSVMMDVATWCTIPSLKLNPLTCDTIGNRVDVDIQLHLLVLSAPVDIIIIELEQQLEGGNKPDCFSSSGCSDSAVVLIVVCRNAFWLKWFHLLLITNAVWFVYISPEVG